MDSGRKLDRLTEVGESTHKIVNSQRTIMLRLVAALSRRIASENPRDAAAQVAADHADADLRRRMVRLPRGRRAALGKFVRRHFIERAKLK